jgi:succinate dehydrogenase/fumarate reductase-like Fe-S protein
MELSEGDVGCGLVMVKCGDLQCHPEYFGPLAQSAQSADSGEAGDTSTTTSSPRVPQCHCRG